MQKNILILILCSFLFQTANAITIEQPVNAKNIIIPIGKTGKTINLLKLSSISEKQFEIITGKKLGFAEKLMFKTAQRKICKSINSDGTINNKKIKKFYKRYYEGDDRGFNLGGFALGFFLTWVGVLIAYIINNDRNHSRRLWAWIGFGVAIVFLAILVIVAFSNGYNY